ncbi:serine/threonine/tyrosine-interacting-like protein 2 isoform X2 [Protopterus annectens]|nr:serine/threonine/tyrosine-interacting-like protein 2 isoform X2 [Protopterus annectens]
MSDTDTESIFMEPIHLSSAVAAKQIINEELKSKDIKVEYMSPEMLESAEQLLVEDLYNRVKEKIDDSSRFNTPCIMDIQRALVQDKLEAPMNPVDEVWPNVFLAENAVAVNKGRLKRMGITHVLNAAHNTGVYTGAEFYSSLGIQYMGIEVDDFPDIDISKHFRPTAEFMDEALLTYRGKILVSSVMGVSRSATFITSYLMIFHHMTVMEALMTIRKKRPINPNEGFLKQLRELNELLMEERQEEFASEESDECDTLSQSSVIDRKAQSMLAEEEDTGSIMGAKVHSISVEEEDTSSSLGSVLSSAAKRSVASKRPTLIDEDEEEQLYQEWRKQQGLPPSEPANSMQASRLAELPEQGEDDNDLYKMIKEWQCRNATYMSDDGESSVAGRYSPSQFSDIESVSSLDIQILKQQLEASGINRQGRRRYDSTSTEDSSWDMWNQRLKEIETEAAERYRSGKEENDNTKVVSEKGERKTDIDEESLFSDTSSLFNFCKKNKDKLTPLERWKIKRIQFGWHKNKSESTDGSKTKSNEDQGEEGEKPISEVNLTAYQNWKLKRQKQLGTENKDEIVELTKGEDAASVRRKQRRAEVLERSRQNLEESQSLCGFETDSSVSGSIPLSTFWPMMSTRSVADDTVSMLSMQSNRSAVSQASALNQTPVLPLPNIQVGPNDSVSLASIQNWIANVVVETIAQKQNEIMMQSRASSVMSNGPKLEEFGRTTEDDKVSMLSMQSGASYSNSLLHKKNPRADDTHSVLSCNSLSSNRSKDYGTRDKIRSTSKPLYSLFADEVNLKELNRKEKEMKTEFSGKMSAYKMEKIAADNKRSTLFKKKKVRGEGEDENEDSASFLDHDNSDTVSNLSGHFSSPTTKSTESTSNVSKWLSGLTADYTTPKYDKTDTLDAKLSRTSALKQSDLETPSFSSSRLNANTSRGFTSPYLMKDSDLRITSRYSPLTETEREVFNSHKVKPEEFSHSTDKNPTLTSFRRAPETNQYLEPESTDTATSRIRPYCPKEGENTENQDLSELATKRKFTQSFSKAEDGNRTSPVNSEDNVDNEEGSSMRRRASRLKPATMERRQQGEGDEEEDDEAAIAAWRNHQEKTRAKLQRLKKE